MSIYQLGLMKKWPHIDSDKIKLSFYFLKHGEKISTARTKEQTEETRNFILDTIRDINEKIKDNNNFPPTPSPFVRLVRIQADVPDVEASVQKAGRKRQNQKPRRA